MSVSPSRIGSGHFTLCGTCGRVYALEKGMVHLCDECRMKVDLRSTQDEVWDWSKRNFGEDDPAGRKLLGVIEELGELTEVSDEPDHILELVRSLGRLSHAQLKQDQNIRLSEDHEKKGKDAIGDMLIYLLNYCGKKGWSLNDILFLTWEQVRLRDWNKNRVSGQVPSSGGQD